MANLTLLDLAARSGSDALTGLIEDVTTFAPEMSAIPAVPRSGTSYKITRRTALPATSFRDVNEGSIPVKSTYTQELKEMYFVDTQLEVDEAIVKADDRSLGDILADEAVGAVRSAGLHIGEQVYSGVSNDAKGFTGLKSIIGAASDLEITAGGSGGDCTSAYLVWLDNQGVHFDVGLNGSMELTPWQKQQIIKSGSGATAKKLMAYVANLSFFIGLAVGSDKSAYRIRLIDEDSSSNYLTDALGAQLLSKVPVGRRFGLRWFMNRTAAYTLQLSRSAVGQTPADSGGAAAFAPMPTELQGIPITITDSIPNDETD